MLKIGFIIYSGLGNAVLTTPMLKAIKVIHPDSQLSVFTWDRCTEVFQDSPYVDEIFNTDIYKNKAILNSLSLDILLTPPRWRTWEHLYRPLLSCAKNIIKLPDSRGWVKHESEYNMDLAKAIGYSGSTPSPYFPTSDKSPTEKYAVLAIGYLKDGAEWHLKQISDNNVWITVSDYLIKTGHKVFFLGSLDDYEIAQNIVSELPHGKALNTCGATTVKQAAAIIKNANIFVGLDCGLTHIASCFQVPSVVAWTFTDRTKNEPLNPNIEIIEIPCDKKSTCQYGSWKNCKNKPCRDLTADMIISGINKKI